MLLSSIKGGVVNFLHKRMTIIVIAPLCQESRESLAPAAVLAPFFEVCVFKHRSNFVFLGEFYSTQQCLVLQHAVM